MYVSNQSCNNLEEKTNKKNCFYTIDWELKLWTVSIRSGINIIQFQPTFRVNFKRHVDCKHVEPRAIRGDTSVVSTISISLYRT